MKLPYPDPHLKGLLETLPKLQPVLAKYDRLSGQLMLCGVSHFIFRMITLN